MSLVDPKNPALWLDGTPRSQNNGFTNGMGEPINWTYSTLRAAAGSKISAAHDRLRQQGKAVGAFYGLSRKSDENLRRMQYSPAIESREAGQKSMHKRDALRRGGI